MPTEREIKIDLVRRGRYERLLRFLGEPDKVINQINFFFDTDDWALSRAGWALRIRRENDSYRMTAKGRRETGDIRIAVRPEHEIDLELGLAESIIDKGMKIGRLRELLDIDLTGIEDKDRLEIKILFENERRVYLHKTGLLELEIELDRTVFSDNSIAYELEAEIGEKDSTAAIDAVEALLIKLRIPVVYQSESKFARALKKSGSKPT